MDSLIESVERWGIVGIVVGTYLEVVDLMGRCTLRLLHSCHYCHSHSRIVDRRHLFDPAEDR